ncbi:MAG TPA: hypothetical protein VF188_17740 [Longimicrobiales bacterium]
MGKRQRRARPAGIFRWRRRLGIFDSPAQVAEELHVRYRLSVYDAWRLVATVQREHGGGDGLEPRQLWRHCRMRLEAGLHLRR